VTSLSRKLTLTLILAVLGCLLISLIYLLYRFGIPGWESLAFYGYLCVSSILVLILPFLVLVKVRRWLRTGSTSRESIIDSIAYASPTFTRTAKIRRLLAELLGSLEFALVWPEYLALTVYFWLAYRWHSKNTPMKSGEVRLRDYSVWLSLRSIDLLTSLSVLTMILLLYTLSIAGVTDAAYDRILIVLLGGSVVVRHLRYFVSEAGLIVNLRRLVANPYITFLMILAADFCILVLSFAAISVEELRLALTMDNIGATLQSLFLFGELTQLFEGNALTITQIITSVAGLLFYLALLSAVTNYGDFRPVIDDYVWLAARHNHLGDFRTSLSILHRVQPKDTRTDSLEIGARLGMKDLNIAEQRARAIIQREGYSLTNDRIFQTVLESTILAPLSDDSMLSVVRYGMDLEVSDYLLLTAIAQCLDKSDNLKSGVQELIAPAESKYPLTLALFVVFDNPAHAIELLDKATPGSELEEVVRLVLKLLANSLHDVSLDGEEAVDLSVEEASALRGWLEQDLPLVNDLLAEVSSSMDKVIIITWLTFVIWVVKDVYDKQQIHELDSLLETLKSEATDDPLSEMAVKASETRMRWLES
jgi:hypothetical protein